MQLRSAIIAQRLGASATVQTGSHERANARGRRAGGVPAQQDSDLAQDYSREYIDQLPKKMISELLGAMEEHRFQMQKLQIQFLVKEQIMTRAQAKRLWQDRPREIHAMQIVKLCKKTIRRFYAAATNEEDMKLRTAGSEERVEVHDRLLLEECFAYLRLNGFKIDGCLLDVGAGFGLRTALLLTISSKYFCFDPDLRMASKFNENWVSLSRENPDKTINYME